MEIRKQAEQILSEAKKLFHTPTELDLFDWAYWPTLDMVESEDAIDERAASGESIHNYVITDMAYRLGEQLPNMAMDLRGTHEERRAMYQSRAARKMAGKLAAIVK